MFHFKIISIFILYLTSISDTGLSLRDTAAERPLLFQPISWAHWNSASRLCKPIRSVSLNPASPAEILAGAANPEEAWLTYRWKQNKVFSFIFTFFNPSWLLIVKQSQITGCGLKLERPWHISGSCFCVLNGKFSRPGLSPRFFPVHFTSALNRVWRYRCHTVYRALNVVIVMYLEFSAVQGNFSDKVYENGHFIFNRIFEFL